MKIIPLLLLLLLLLLYVVMLQYKKQGIGQRHDLSLNTNIILHVS